MKEGIGDGEMWGGGDVEKKMKFRLWIDKKQCYL